MKRSICAAAVFAAFLVSAGRPAAQELAAWIPSTDRSANPLIAEILLYSPLQDRLAAAEALGLRSDPFVGDLIALLVAQLHGPGRHEEELALRVLLASVFPRSAEPEDLRGRLTANRSALELLAAALPELEAPLARETYRLLGNLPSGRLRAAMADEGRRLSEELKRRQGRSSAEQADRLMEFLKAAERSADPSLAPAVVAMLEVTRTPEVGQQARQVLEKILSREAVPLRTSAGNPPGS